MPIHSHVFEVDGIEHGLRLTHNALVLLERRTGVPSGQTLAAVTQVGDGEHLYDATAMQSLLWAMLEGHRRVVEPDRAEYGFDDVGVLIDAVGGPEAALRLIGAAFQAGAPSRKEGGAPADAEADPQLRLALAG